MSTSLAIQPVLDLHPAPLRKPAKRRLPAESELAPPELAPSELAQPEKFSTGSRALDRLLDGGLAPGEMVEVYGERTSGRFSLVLKALAAAIRRFGSAALVDLGDGLDPRTAAESGVELERLLWARPRLIEEALASADLLVQSGLPLVILELGFPPLAGGRGAETSWHRLARSARSNGVAILLSSPYRVSANAAQVVLEAFQPQPRWQGPSTSSRLLNGVESQVEVRRLRRSSGGRRQEGQIEALSHHVLSGIAGPTDMGPWLAEPVDRYEASAAPLGHRNIA